MEYYMTEFKKEQLMRRLGQFIFLLYVLVLIKTILFKFVTLGNLGGAFFTASRNCNFIPFKSIADLFKNASAGQALRNILGNILLFMPIGWLIPVATEYEREAPFFGLCISIFFEVAQLAFAMGRTDVDDIILNTLGALAGYIVYRITVKFIHSQFNITLLYTALTAALSAALCIIMYIEGTLI